MLYSQGLLHFKKWGHIDNISNYPVRYALFVDYDRKRLPQRAHINKINATFRAAGFSYLALRISPTARGWHYVFLLARPVSAMARVAMESILGDDSMRAAMNFARARNAHKMPKFWRQRWNIFYDYKLVKK